MPVALRLRKVEIIHDKSTNATKSADHAEVHLLVTSKEIGEIPLSVTVVGFSTIDDAIDKARQIIFTYASELAIAADQRPLK